MAQNEIKTLDLVRRIRDEQAEFLREESREEIQAFFHREAEAANEEAKRLLRERDASIQPISDQAEPIADY